MISFFLKTPVNSRGFYFSELFEDERILRILNKNDRDRTTQ